MALCSSTATTVESMPPERAQTTCLSPILSAISLTTRSTKLDMLQSGTILQILNRKLRSMRSPSTLWCTSGWNCTA